MRKGRSAVAGVWDVQPGDANNTAFKQACSLAKQKCLDQIANIIAGTGYCNIAIVESSAGWNQGRGFRLVATDFTEGVFAKLEDLTAAGLLMILQRCAKPTAPFGCVPLDLLQEGMADDPDSRLAALNLRLLLAEKGLSNGLYIPVNCSHQRYACVMLFGNSSNVSKGIADLADDIAKSARQMVITLRSHRLAAHNITERERECLAWVAEGKTSAELAQIIGLSEHTVNHYLLSATRKMDSVNRIQAVVKAVYKDLI